jgi:hypothetical protein
MSAHANGMRWVFQAHGEEKSGKKVSGLFLKNKPDTFFEQHLFRHLFP